MNNKQRLMMLTPPLLATFACGSPALAATAPTDPEPAVAPGGDPAATSAASGASVPDGRTEAPESPDASEPDERPGDPRPLDASAPDQPSHASTPSGDTEPGERSSTPEPVSASERDQRSNPAEPSDTSRAAERSTGPEALTSSGSTTATGPSGPAALQPTGTRTVILRPELPTDMGEDERDAVQVVNHFWERNWSRNFPGTYEPPSVLGRYDPANPPLCGDIRLEPANAYYCPSGDYITWDADFIKGDPILEGNTFPYIAIAHEWGHAVQHRMNKLAGPAAQVELQADCLTGATLTGARDEGYLEWEPLDRERLRVAIARIGDELPDDDPAHHGSPEERVSAFEIGEQGVHACLGQP